MTGPAYRFIFAQCRKWRLKFLSLGKLEEQAGKLGLNPELEAQGRHERVAGKVQQVIGKIKSILGK